MKRDAAEIIQVEKLRVLHGVVEVVLGLDEPLRQVGLALLALHGRQSGENPEDVLVRPVNLHTEHFDEFLPAQASVTLLMRRLQLDDPQVTIPAVNGDKHIRSVAPLFEIVSSLELAGTNPRINWWVRAGQWSLWGLTPFDRHVLCRFASTVIVEKDPKYHRLLALMALSVSSRVDEVFRPGKVVHEDGGPTIEIKVNAIRDDLVDLEKMLNFLPKETDLSELTGVVIDDFVGSELLQYTDASHETVRILHPVNLNTH